tara:strand:- start:253 stop:414 length:162 start_codon:yes stop_codon:yes gene_type:complete
MVSDFCENPKQLFEKSFDDCKTCASTFEIIDEHSCLILELEAKMDVLKANPPV